jgi:8-oxo-dGTP pyrophosphatase MutT (NUDIX family)
MTIAARIPQQRTVHFHDPEAPKASVIVPSVFVAVQGRGGRLLLVRRCDSGSWELPGGRVDIGETAAGAAVRETAEESGVQVLVTGLVGVFTDPNLVVRALDGEVRQQFVVIFRARVLSGTPHGDLHETSDAAWVAFPDLRELAIEPHMRVWMEHALAVEDPPHFD